LKKRKGEKKKKEGYGYGEGNFLTGRRGSGWGKEREDKEDCSKKREGKKKVSKITTSPLRKENRNSRKNSAEGPSREPKKKKREGKKTPGRIQKCSRRKKKR